MKNIYSLFCCAVVLVLSGAGLCASEPATESTYPLKTCVVSGKSLDSMGEPYVHQAKVVKDGVESTVEVQFCCKPCTKTFEKDPAKYLEKLDKAKAGS